MVNGDVEVDLRPGEDGDEGDTEDERVFDAEGHEEGRDDTAAEDGHPELLRSDTLSGSLSGALTFGLDISPPSHMPVVPLIISEGHPPRARGVEAQPPVMAPMPALYERPISVRKKPMPTPVAVLMVAGMSFTSHWRMPVRARKTKMRPSMKTAVRAVS